MSPRFFRAKLIAASACFAMVAVTVAVPASATHAPSAFSPAPTESVQYTIMGDSHVVVMINDMYPGYYSSGNEGTLIHRTFLVYALNGIKLSQVVNGRGVVKAGESSVGTTNVNKWRKAISSGPNTIVVNLGTNDGGPSAKDIDKFMRIAGKDRRVFWIAPFYTSCPACRAIHDYELKAAAKRFPNFTIIKVADLGLNLSSDGLHAFGKANSRAIWERIEEMVLPIAGPQPIPNAA